MQRSKRRALDSLFDYLVGVRGLATAKKEGSLILELLVFGLN
jgi:hypothetical protein